MRTWFIRWPPLLVGGALFAACPGALFQDTSPETRAEIRPWTITAAVDRNLRPLARPSLVVTPLEVGQAAALTLDVTAHAPITGARGFQIDAQASDRGTALGPVSLRYVLAGRLRLPVEPGDHLLALRWGDGLALFAADPTGELTELRAIVAIDPGPPPDARLAPWVQALTPLFSPDDLVSADVDVAPSGCVRAIDHHLLDVRLPRADGTTGRTLLAPGAHLRVHVNDRAATLYVFDVGRTPPRRPPSAELGCAPPPHVSWALLLDAPSAPEASAP